MSNEEEFGIERIVTRENRWRYTGGVVVNIPEGAEKIDDFAFFGSNYVEKVFFPMSLKRIGERAFRECGRLKSVELPGGVTTIGCQAFQDCKSLESVTIPRTVESIGESAFCGCGILTHVTIEPGVKKIEDYAFKDCKLLESITIPGTVESIGSYVFNGCKILKHVTIEPGVKKIRFWAFERCDSLESLTLPEGIEEYSIPVNIKKLEVPSSIVSDKETALTFFENYSHLQKLTINNNGKKITINRYDLGVMFEKVKKAAKEEVVQPVVDVSREIGDAARTARDTSRKIGKIVGAAAREIGETVKNSRK